MISTTKTFSKTPIQRKATQLMASKSKHIMCYGGSRSGKTFIILYAMIMRAAKKKSRHCVLRYKFNHVKTSVWYDTLPKVLELCFPKLKIKFNNTDFFIRLDNGSEIWLSGLDNEKQMEKILGKEYSTIFFNECSQLPYTGIELVRTRLAENSGLINKFYYDENPPQKRHWSYQLFIRGINPKTGLAINRDNYTSILMNPRDNQINLPDDYFEILADLSPEERARFEFGEFLDSSDGQAYYAFNQEEHVKDLSELTSDIIRRYGAPLWKIGMDFNVNPMTACIGFVMNNCIYIIDEVYQLNSDTYQACKELKTKGFYGTVFPDSTGNNRSTTGLSNFDILKNEGFHVNYSLNPYQVDRVNNLNRLFAQDRIIIDKKCVKLINDLEKVTWKGAKLDQSGEFAMLTHISDSLGYMCWGLEPLTSTTKAKIKIN